MIEMSTDNRKKTNLFYYLYIVYRLREFFPQQLYLFYKNNIGLTKFYKQS